MADVSPFLVNHGIKACAEVIETVDESGTTLIELASSSHADLIVSGAYGGSIASCQADLLSTATT